jgi:hypothetical protein
MYREMGYNRLIHRMLYARLVNVPLHLVDMSTKFWGLPCMEVNFLPRIRFGKGMATVKGIVRVPTPLGIIKSHVVPTNTPFLLCLQDMDAMGVQFDNLKNVLIQGNKIIPVVRKWGHPWMLLNKLEETLAWSHLTET